MWSNITIVYCNYSTQQMYKTIMYLCTGMITYILGYFFNIKPIKIILNYHPDRKEINIIHYGYFNVIKLKLISFYNQIKQSSKITKPLQYLNWLEHRIPDHRARLFLQKDAKAYLNILPITFH